MIAVRKDADNSLWETQEFGVGNDRISQTNYANSQTRYYYGAIEYTETNNNGSLIWSKSYVYLGDAILSTISNNGSGGETVEYNHPDRLGTKVVTNQQAGTSIEQNALPFGTALNAESTGSTAKRFTSYERSSRTGLDYAQNRTYDSKQGRFTQVDEIGMRATLLDNPQTLNLYSYCVSDPINKVDPTGLSWFSKFVKVMKKIGNLISNIVKIAVFVAIMFVAVSTFGVALGIVVVALSMILTNLMTIIATTVYRNVKESIRENGWSLSSILKGVGKGIKKSVGIIKSILSRKLQDFFVPVYGYWCAPGYGIDGSTNGQASMDGLD